MFNYVLRRLLITPLLLLGVSVLIFSVISLMTPTDRAQALFNSELSNRSRPRDFDGLIEKYGLDDPVYLQYWHWLVGQKVPDSDEIKGGVLRGNLGWSQVGRSSVLDVIKRRSPATVELILWSIFPMIVLSIWLGVKSAVNQNRLIDHVLRIAAITGWSIPTFVIGFVLLMYFAVQNHILAPGRLTLDIRQIVDSAEFINYTQMHTLDALLNFRFDVFWDAFQHLILPSITLVVANFGYLYRVSRFSMLETLGQDYITTARSRGIPEEWVINKHALPNALNPVITVGGLILVGFLNNVVITEVVFNLPGLGTFLADAAISLDLISVAGVTLVSSIVLILANLFVDILYGVVDPRVRLD